MKFEDASPPSRSSTLSWQGPWSPAVSLPQRRESRSQCGLEPLPSAVLARALPASTLGEAFPAGAARSRLHGPGPGRRAPLLHVHSWAGGSRAAAGRGTRHGGRCPRAGRALRRFAGVVATPPVARPVPEPSRPRDRAGPDARIPLALEVGPPRIDPMR